LSYRGKYPKIDKFHSTSHLRPNFVQIILEHYAILSGFVKGSPFFGPILQKIALMLDKDAPMLYTAGLAKFKWIALWFDIEAVCRTLFGAILETTCKISVVSTSYTSSCYGSKIAGFIEQRGLLAHLITIVPKWPQSLNF